ncbi:hypothetical protein [Nonomuraea rubra]|uniref:Uncharacterized protein n=1 Tax=Nonomuraea rubra TaxID=46180 RepID=A0A7X0P6F6_9ACTN|nr:hypothetical protein [Nonomuraea rubra]MBB6556136.1 hypothetical protein [Nonomuraea rubra]
MTSARVAAMHARRGLEFLDVCEGYEQRLAAAKQAVKDATGEQQAEAVAALKTAKAEMRGFREWARTVGRPPEGVPGRDATIRIGGPVSHGMDR